LARATAFQAVGRGFESRFPLIIMTEIKIGRDANTIAHFVNRDFLGNVPASFLPEKPPVKLVKRRKKWEVTHQAKEAKGKITGVLVGAGTDSEPITIDVEKETDLYLIFLATCYFVLKKNKSLYFEFGDECYEFRVHKSVVVISAFQKFPVDYPPPRSFVEIEADLFKGKHISTVEQRYYDMFKDADEDKVSGYLYDAMFPLDWLKAEALDELQNTDEAMFIVAEFINFVNSDLNDLG
jgi:hypothetical protein